MPGSFHVHRGHAHLRWSNAIAPVLTVPSGSEVTFDLRDGGNNQVRPDNAATALADFDFAQADPAFGPVRVEGAEPGDVLRVDILACEPADYGWTAVLPGFGLLADEFPEPALKLWDLSGGGGGGAPRRRAVFKPGVTVALRPFLGVIGIAPAEAGELSTVPPYPRSGGNMDTRYLGPGATLYLPVQVPGALLSCGDGHAAQGDGEVCGTAIETPMRARLRLTVEKRGSGSGAGAAAYVAACPHYTTAAAAGGHGSDEDRGVHAALGIHADPREAARMAVRGLIDWLEADKGLTRVEGYMLASVAASLKMTEVVDMPNFAVACSIPLNCFDE